MKPGRQLSYKCKDGLGDDAEVVAGGGDVDIMAGDDDHNHDADAGGGDEGEEQFCTKAELYKAYSGKGPVRMFADFTQDPTLRDHAVILDRIARPLETEYNYDLEQQRQGRQQLLDFGLCFGRRFLATAVLLFYEAPRVEVS